MEEGARWSFVTGECNDTLILSLRAAEESLGAGKTIAATLDGRGSCGGHAVMAGGQVPLDGLDEAARGNVREEILDSFLDVLKVKRTLRRPLVPPDEPGDEEE